MTSGKRSHDSGYAVHEGVLSTGECMQLLDSLASDDVGRSRAGARHLLHVPAIAHLANDERLINIARAALGETAVPFRVTLFDKSPDSNWSVVWHQDTALPLEEKSDREGWGPWSLKGGVNYAHAPAEALERVVALRVHLDDSTPSNGPLRVIEGSHRLGVLSDDDVSKLAHETRPVSCPVARGGVLAMRPLIIHSSERIESPAPRRVLHIEYAEEFEIAPGMYLCRR